GSDSGGGAGYGNFNDLTHRKRFPGVGGFPFDDGVTLLSVVGHYKPNAWKLHDMAGNVAEWCQDSHQKYSSTITDEFPVEEGGDSSRILRGGSWLDSPFLCRSAARASIGPSWRRDFVGFRVAMPTNP